MSFGHCDGDFLGVYTTGRMTDGAARGMIRIKKRKAGHKAPCSESGEQLRKGKKMATKARVISLYSAWYESSFETYSEWGLFPMPSYKTGEIAASE